jgi:hypothetical protein
MNQATADFMRLCKYLKGKGFRPLFGVWNKYNIVVERGNAPMKYNLYRGINGEAYWNITAAKIRQLLTAG